MGSVKLERRRLEKFMTDIGSKLSVLDNLTPQSREILLQNIEGDVTFKKFFFLTKKDKFCDTERRSSTKYRCRNFYFSYV